MHPSDLPTGFDAPANLLQIGMLMLLFFGQMFTVWQTSRADRSKAINLAEAQTKANGEIAAAVKKAGESNERLAKALESITEWARKHDLDDARFQEKMVGVTSTLTDTVSRLTDMQANLGGQIINVANGRAMQDSPEVIPPNAASRRRAR